jgi:hypothetical protein
MIGGLSVKIGRLSIAKRKKQKKQAVLSDTRLESKRNTLCLPTTQV